MPVITLTFVQVFAGVFLGCKQFLLVERREINGNAQADRQWLFDGLLLFTGSGFFTLPNEGLYRSRCSRLSSLLSLECLSVLRPGLDALVDIFRLLIDGSSGSLKSRYCGLSDRFVRFFGFSALPVGLLVLFHLYLLSFG